MAAADERAEAWAEAFFLIAKAEGVIGEVEDELFRFARIFEGNDELRERLADPHIPVVNRQQAVEELLEGKATPVTIGLVSALVAAGRVRSLPAAADALVQACAAEGHKAVAEVRSAMPLTDDQKARLAEALQHATGKQVEVKVIIDPSIQGGVVAQIGDIVIDGSVKHRLEQLKQSL